MVWRMHNPGPDISLLLPTGNLEGIIKGEKILRMPERFFRHRAILYVRAFHFAGLAHVYHDFNLNNPFMPCSFHGPIVR